MLIEKFLSPLLVDLTKALETGDSARIERLARDVIEKIRELAPQFAEVLEAFGTDFGVEEPESLDERRRREEGRTTRGIQVNILGGEGRDRLLALLSGLASIDNLVGIAERTYNLLDARLPSPANLFAGSGALVAGAQVQYVTVEQLTIQSTAENVQELFLELSDLAALRRRGGG